MRKIFRSRRSVITLAAVVLLAVWALWYARPLSVRDLMGGANPETVQALIVDAELQSDFKWKTGTGTFVCDEGPVMDELFSQLDGLRFHRNPLEVVLQFLPRDGGEITGKSFNLYAYDQSGKEIGGIRTGCPCIQATMRKKPANPWAHGFGRTGTKTDC